MALYWHALVFVCPTSVWSRASLYIHKKDAHQLRFYLCCHPCCKNVKTSYFCSEDNTELNLVKMPGSNSSYTENVIRDKNTIVQITVHTKPKDKVHHLYQSYSLPLCKSNRMFWVCLSICVYCTEGSYEKIFVRLFSS